MHFNGLLQCYFHDEYNDVGSDKNLSHLITRNSSGDEIANVNFLYDDIVHALKI